MIRPIQNQMSRAGSRPRQPDPAAVTRTETGTALVLVSQVAAGEQTALPPRRTSASYLAHLIATDRGEPQTRERRRATTQEAIAAYGVMKNLSREKMRTLSEIDAA